MIAQLRTLVRYRALIETLVVRELKARYRGSVLGFVWSFINPLLQLVTYGVVFAYMLPVARSAAMEPYLLFFACGILPWTFTQAGILEGATTLVGNGAVLKKVLFPPEILPAVSVVTNLCQLLLAIPILFVVVLWNDRLTPWALLMPLPLAVQTILVLGLSLGLSALTVHFRDLVNILGHLLHIWFFATPVLYLYSDIGGVFREALRWNPMTHIVVSYQQMLFEGRFDHWRGLGASALSAGIALHLGSRLFDRMRDALVEEI